MLYKKCGALQTETGLNPENSFELTGFP